jgi:hypothetical protein
MGKSRFTEMFSAINKTDYKRFTELVDSPYFNKNERVKSLWKWLMENPKPEYTKQELISATGGEMNYANFRMVLSDFVKLIEIFLLLERNELISTQRDELIIALGEKTLTKSYNKHLRVLKEKCATEKNKGVQYYNDKYFIECEALIKDKQSKKAKRISAIDELTDYMWLCMKLDNFAKANVLGADVTKLLFYNEINSLIEQNQKYFAKHHPVVYSRWKVVKAYI